MTHDFKAGDRAIVLPVNLEYAFDIVDILSVVDGMFLPISAKTRDRKKYYFFHEELQPLPIPYHLLDAE